MWLTGVGVAAAGLVIATPATPAFACGGQAGFASGGTGLQATAVARLCRPAARRHLASPSTTPAAGSGGASTSKSGRAVHRSFLR